MQLRFTPAPRRVLMTADTIGGVWTYALELARALAPHGVEFIIATMGARLTQGQIRETRSLVNVEICESDFKLEWMESPWSDVARAGDWLLEIAASNHPDVIHLNGYAHAALNWPAPVLAVAHSCVLSWWEAVKGMEAPGEWQHYRENITAGIRVADLVIAPSHAMLEAAQKHYGPFQGAQVIYNARDAASFQCGTKQNLVLTAGRFWDEAKNLPALADIASELPWPLLVAGETGSPARIKPASSKVCALGRLSAEELTRWYSRAAIYALPALYEPFGLSILEAALAGCALVLGDIPSLREIWSDAAMFVPPRDGAALKSVLLGLMHDNVKLRQMAALARARALEFNPRRMAEHYLSAYERVMQLPVNQNRELVICES